MKQKKQMVLKGKSKEERRKQRRTKDGKQIDTDKKMGQ